MAQLRLPKSVQRITIAGESGGLVLYKKKRKKKKDDKLLKPMRKAMRKLARAQAVTSNSYVDRFERSSEKKKNGWLKDAPKNFMRATKKGLKKLK